MRRRVRRRTRVRVRSGQADRPVIGGSDASQATLFSYMFNGYSIASHMSRSVRPSEPGLRSRTPGTPPPCDDGPALTGDLGADGTGLSTQRITISKCETALNTN
ncbi:hypothetical protein GCM10010517_63720 [Streptosporangium fragile]|uniref:Uncharacterized protein n=1 Tax=Streptosporangium fragile TaxID=46186 RepID=A0ABP6IM74_9ACTN